MQLKDHERLFTDPEAALLELGFELKKLNYKFTTVTPATHERILKRDRKDSPETIPVASLRDIFGWNRRFEKKYLCSKLFELLQRSAALVIDGAEGEFYRSRIRFSSLNDSLFLHSGYPTGSNNSVFFGPDTYRYVRFVLEQFSRITCENSTLRPRVVDLGCGSGAAGLVLRDSCSSLVLSDINSLALSYSRINEKLNPSSLSDVSFVESDLFLNIHGDFDLVIANPPFMMDPGERSYRHGGEQLGSELSLKIVKDGLAHLRPGGFLFLYTATAIVAGHDLFKSALSELLYKAEYKYWEIDPDIFSEELELPNYAAVERIAAVGLVVRRSLLD
jgi:release factor glutamine methyltransferase